MKAGVLRCVLPALLLVLQIEAGQAQKTEPVAKFLNPDGTLSFRSRFSGALDARGWRLTVGPKGEPRFLPATGTAVTSAADSSWDNRFRYQGITGSVEAVAMMGTDLVVGGEFTSAGASGAKNIARWDGTSWSALGTGVDGTVQALAVIGTDLYVGGWFNTAGGMTANHIAKWDGHAWSALGLGMDQWYVSSLAVIGTDLYAGGNFDQAGGISANRIAKWDGSSWSPLGSGLNSNVNALAVIGTDLYAGGLFDSAGGIRANYVARWDGTGWSALGVGTDGWVYALAAMGTDLYVGGSFLNAGGMTANDIAKWDGASWSVLGLGVSGGSLFSQVNALAVSGSDLYVGGSFTQVGVLNVGYIAKWNGSWSGLSTGMSNEVFALGFMDSSLVAGGFFATAGGVKASNIARWSGTTWSPLFDAFSGQGVDYQVVAMATRGSEVYVGGSFLLADGLVSNFVARWDGSSWSKLGSGMNGDVFALAVVDSDVYAGGYFDTAGGVPAKYIARWDGSGWSSLGSGMDAPVWSLAAVGDDLYAGGLFSSAGGVGAGYIAMWNGTNWSALGTGMNDAVNALTSMGPDLYAGGSFTIAGGMTANRIAMWNGSAWSALGTGVSGAPFIPVVFALAARGTDLYAGGVFDTAGGLPAGNIARWDGSSWSALGSGAGGPDADVGALAVTGTDLYAGGSFTIAGGTAANRIAKWDGSTWSALGSGTDGAVLSLAPVGNDLYVGGYFGSAGGNLASCFSRWKIANSPRWSWARAAGSSGGIFCTGVASDDSGNVYAAGEFAGTVDFGKGPITSVGSTDVFLAKYNSQGTLLWAVRGGGSGDDVAYGVAVDHAGDIYLAGFFTSADAVYDTVSLSRPGSSYDVFLIKYNRAGRALWARSAGGSSDEYAQSVAVDGSGNAYIAGEFQSSSLQFGSNPPLANAGSYDMFLAKYSPAGVALWSRSAGGTGVDDAMKVSADSAGNAYCTGYFTSSSLTFGGNPSLSTNGHEDIFVVRYDSGGTAIWSHSAGGSQTDQGICIASDREGNVYAAGEFSSPSITFGSTTLNNATPNLDLQDVCLVKYSAAGSVLWARQAGGWNSSVPTALTVDGSGNAALAGWFSSHAFPIGRFSLSNTDAPQSDLFVTEYDSTGRSLWVKSANGGTQSEYPNGIASDPAGNLLVAGLFTSPLVQFDANVVTSSASVYNLFLAKLGVGGVPPPIEQTTSVRTGWNMVSLPVVPPNDSTDVLFPGAAGHAFSYGSGGYQVSATMTPGIGYWLKFPTAASVSISGAPISVDTIAVAQGWNLIGSISQPVLTSTIASIPPGLVTTQFFAYSGSYVVSDSINPGMGYWVKVSGGGQLILGSSGAARPISRIRIVPTSERPPQPPKDEPATRPGPRMPGAFALEQNYPNPFNPSTVIRYQLPVQSRVTIRVYNVVGQEVATLVDGMQQPGYKSVEWNASGFGSGVYFCRFQASGFTQTRKLIVLK